MTVNQIKDALDDCKHCNEVRAVLMDGEKVFAIESIEPAYDGIVVVTLIPFKGSK